MKLDPFRRHRHLRPSLRASAHLLARAEDLDIATDARPWHPRIAEGFAWDPWDDDDLDGDDDVWTARPLRVPLGEIARIA